MERVPGLPEEVQAYKAELVERLSPEGNILGVGFGAKIVGGRPAADRSIRVYVRSKLPPYELAPEDLVPAEVAGLPTDVIPVGDIVAYRPVKWGVSIGHVDITAGTLGGLLVIDGDDSSYILSNNHVMANVNQANIGDSIVEPGPADGGTEPIAELADFEPIELGGPANTIDAAIARVLDPADVLPEIEVIGPVQNPPLSAALYQSVRKHGRTTLHTVGVIMDISADIWVRVLPQANAWFEDQLVVVGAGAEFSQPGDSGSLVVDGVTSAPVGLLFAGGSGHTFMNPIEPVLQRFNASFVTPIA